MSDDQVMRPFGQLVGKWKSEATHPKMPGVVVHGTTVIEWLEGERFLIVRASTDHPDFPDSISIIGNTSQDRVEGATGKIAGSADDDALHLHYYDERGVFRDYVTRWEGTSWLYSREVKGFSQRFTGKLTNDGATIVGLSQLREDDVHWTDDLAITYQRER
ncbi:MAG: hypothetical protein ABI852_08270 [Gemmatimonadaceae bacterium]